MEELFETFDKSGNPLGIFLRSEAHRKGLWHRAANVFLFYPNGKLLLQRRQLNKDVWPGAWDVSAAEHLKPGESFEQGAIRGLQEELGVIGVKLEIFGGVINSRLKIAKSGIEDNEFQQSFKTVYDGPVTPDPSEVMDIKSVSIQELKILFQDDPEAFTPWFRHRTKTLNIFKDCP